jgi:hypothetical protein
MQRSRPPVWPARTQARATRAAPRAAQTRSRGRPRLCAHPAHRAPTPTRRAAPRATVRAAGWYFCSRALILVFSTCVVQRDAVRNLAVDQHPRDHPWPCACVQQQRHCLGPARRCLCAEYHFCVAHHGLGAVRHRKQLHHRICGCCDEGAGPACARQRDVHVLGRYGVACPIAPSRVCSSRCG